MIVLPDGDLSEYEDESNTGSSEEDEWVPEERIQGGEDDDIDASDLMLQPQLVLSRCQPSLELQDKALSEDEDTQVDRDSGVSAKMQMLPCRLYPHHMHQVQSSSVL